MKKLKKIVCILLAAAMILGCNLVSFASEVDVSELPTIHDHLVESLVKGASKPSSSAGTVDLRQANYGYDVTSIGYRVYTNKWSTGADSIYVSVADWTLIEQYHGAEDSELTVAVYDSSDNVVAKNTIEIEWAHDGTGYGSLTLSGLNENGRYYVLFEVPTNGNRYSFNGIISRN